MVVKGGTTATVWFTGPPTGPAGTLAVNVANALLASGWKAVPQ
jgi:adenylylsulfate kinase-like enzyme